MERTETVTYEMSARRYEVRTIGQNLSGALSIAVGLFTPMLRSRRANWGATSDEIEHALPGDEFVPNPRWSSTQAITIQAGIDQVWPWLVQIGQARGGFYSYELLENLIGGQIRNADKIVPEFQKLQIGDEIKLHPRVPGLPVVRIEPERAIVLNGRQDIDTGETFALDGQSPEKYLNVSWLFYIEPAGSGSTRLIVRWRSDYNPSRANQLGYGPLLVEPISSVMHHEMLRGIKQRAEAAHTRAA